MVGMSLAAMGFYGIEGPVLRHAPMFLERHGAGRGLRLINSIGNLGGFFGPWWSAS